MILFIFFILLILAFFIKLCCGFKVCIPYIHFKPHNFRIHFIYQFIKITKKNFRLHDFIVDKIMQPLLINHSMILFTFLILLILAFFIKLCCGFKVCIPYIHFKHHNFRIYFIYYLIKIT